MKRIIFNPIYWAIGWVLALVGERLYGNLDLYDLEDLDKYESEDYG